MTRFQLNCLKKKDNQTMKTSFNVQLPGWAEEFANALVGKTFVDDRAKMHLAIHLSKQNIEQQTGGPFGAAIFDTKDNTLVSLGVNIVTNANCSVLHAEMVAIMLAQGELGTFDLSTKGRYELFSSTEPCAMCLGAIPWSGVSRVVTAATEADAEAIGFNEGHKPDAGIDVLMESQIEVLTELLRSNANAVLQQYAQTGGEIYNTQAD